MAIQPAPRRARPGRRWAGGPFRFGAGYFLRFFFALPLLPPKAAGMLPAPGPLGNAGRPPGPPRKPGKSPGPPRPGRAPPPSVASRSISDSSAIDLGAAGSAAAGAAPRPAGPPLGAPVPAIALRGSPPGRLRLFLAAFACRAA